MPDSSRVSAQFRVIGFHWPVRRAFLQRGLIMIKNCLFAVALLSLALAGGCAKGGNGAGHGISVTVSDGNLAALYVTQSGQLTAAVTGNTDTAASLSLKRTACAGTPHPCR